MKSEFHLVRYPQKKVWLHIQTWQCTVEQTGGSCGVHCSHSCHCSAGVVCILVLPQASLPAHTSQPSFSNPIYLVMESLELQSLSGPSNGQPGKNSLDVLDECS